MQISMAILGKNKILPLLGTSRISRRHQLLKLIAHLLPRYERCTCNECEVFSGIFGSTFWHENVSPSLHHWLNKESSTMLPMAAFPHLRKICNAGFIVDDKGNNNYLIHPERMAFPTQYISGGRSLLVSPLTSFLANKYMKLHQPKFRHGRVVVDGFGHSDLLIGEKSCKEVFPHILSHIELAEKEGAITGDARERYNRGRHCLGVKIHMMGMGALLLGFPLGLLLGCSYVFWSCYCFHSSVEYFLHHNVGKVE